MAEIQIGNGKNSGGYSRGAGADSLKHNPVLLKEVIAYLEPKPGEEYIDATIGTGGHAKEIIKLGGGVLGIDADESVILNLIQDPSSGFRLGGRNDNGVPRLKPWYPPYPPSPEATADKVIHGNFAELESIAKAQNFTEAAGVLFDLGLGSHQLDDPERGFTFQKEGPLDMRFDQSQKISAFEIVNKYSEKDLAKIFYEFGEEKRFGKKIARGIAEVRKVQPIAATAELFQIIKAAVPGKFRHKAGDTARRIFQSLRIAVNDELRNLEKALPQALRVLKVGGRLVVISFHSLEDRIVKKFLAENSKNCVCPPSFPICRCDAKAKLRILTKKPVVPSEEEIKTNPRARSAKLRAAEKIAPT